MAMDQVRPPDLPRPSLVTGRATDVGALILLSGVALALRLPNLTSHGLYRDDAGPVLGARTGLGESAWE